MRQILALLLSFSLGTPAFARDDDRYTYNPGRYQDFQNSYKQPDRSSPSFALDRQISNLNNALQFRFNKPAPEAPSFSFKPITPSLPQPKFQFSLPAFKPLAAFKAELPKPQAVMKVEPRGFFGILGAGIKALVHTFTNAVQKIGRAIGSLVGRATRVISVDRAQIKYEAQRDRILQTNPNLQEISKGTFQVQAGKTLFHGGITWEGGSTFGMDADGRGFHLNQGVTLSPDLGGIRRADGKPIPVTMVVSENRYTPTGIDFTRIDPKTAFNYSHPVTLEGLGTIPSGATMTYEGINPGTKNDPTPGFVLSFQNARIENPGQALESIPKGGQGPTSLTQMEIQLQGAINRINGLHLTRGQEKLYVSRYGESFSVTELEKKTTQARETSTTLSTQSKKLTDGVTSAVIHTRAMMKGLHGHTGTTVPPDFQVRPTLQEQRGLAKDLAAKTEALARQLEQGNYGEVANAITELGQTQEALRNEMKGQKAQVEAFQQYKRSLKGLEQAYKSLAPAADPASLKTTQVTADQIRSAAPYFTEEKNQIRIQTTNALKALDALELAGAITPQENAMKSAEVIGLSRHLLAAKPDKFGDAVNQATAAITEHYQAVSKDFDEAIFNHLDALAERYPRTMGVVGQGALAVAGGAALVGVGYGVAVAPATAVVGLEAGIISQKTFEAMGLPPEIAAYCTAIVTAPAVAVAEGSTAMTQMNKTWVSGIKSFLGDLGQWFKGGMESGVSILKSKAGYVVNPKIGKSRPSSMVDSLNPVGTPNYYVRPNGENIPATGYRYIRADSTQLPDLINTGVLPASPRGTYITFDRFNDVAVARGKLQINREAPIMLEFDAKQLLDDLAIPRGMGGLAQHFEPITQDYPALGPGGATQAITRMAIRVKKITDLRSGKVLYERY